jgi:hypothetical protein
MNDEPTKVNIDEFCSNLFALNLIDFPETYFSDKNDLFAVDGSNLNDTSVDNVPELDPTILSKLEQIKDNIASFTLSGSVLHFTLVDKIILSVRQSPVLIELNLSYFMMSLSSLDILCAMMNPISGSHTIRRLILTKSNIGKNLIKLIKSLCGNVTLEELNVTGNNCGDEIMPSLRNYLVLSDNSLTSLSLGGNRITSSGNVIRVCNFHLHNCYVIHFLFTQV